MATTRPSNLKDRIAALQQRTTSNATSPPTSPTTSTAPAKQSVGTLKDKIAKFERKGRVPVPRGSFGLGAPPVADGPKRQGELYGNRIQAQYTGSSLASAGSQANANPSQRRSFSASVLTGNFDDNYLDSTPIPSPTSTAPLDSPGNSPEASPSRPTNGDIPVVRRNATRGTSFHEALEFARKVEAAKQEALMLPIKKQSVDSADDEEKVIEDFATVPVEKIHSEEEEVPLAPTPAILVSSDAQETASPVPPVQLALIGSLVEPEVAEVKPSAVDGQERMAESTDVGSDDRIAPKAESVEGSTTPSEIDHGTSTGTTPITPLSFRPSTTTARVAGPIQRPLPVPPRLETLPSGKHERGKIAESNLAGSDSTFKQTPQIVLNDVKSRLPVDGKDLSVDTETLVTADASPKVVGTSPVPNGPIPTEALAPVDEQPPKTRSQIPVPRARPTIEPPDASSFLSPPPSGFRPAQISSGASVSSMSSGSRPISMFEMSPSEVSRALKMTPATGRGIPVFLPPANLQTRKSDFVFLPPSPEEGSNTEAGPDVESNSLGHHKAGSESDLASNSFKAVVHGKVKQIPASATLPAKRQFMPETPLKDLKRATILQSPLSPGHGELATLLQEAMLLEDTLNKGELPDESPADESMNAGADTDNKSSDAARLKEDRQRIAQASAQLRAKRDLPTHGRLKHTFLMPLTKARAVQKQELSTPVEQASPRISREDSRPKGAESGVGAKEVIHEKSAPIVTQSSPSKIPKLSKFPSFKRFGSISRTAAQQEAFLRHSTSMSSEISSEDSNLIVTPPDNAPLEFGERRSTTRDADQQSSHSQALSFSFPSLSPKKGASIGRAASFAEKIWSRARTKSNGSVLSSSGMTHRSTEELTPQLPVLSELPSLGSIDPPLTGKEPVSTAPPISSIPTSSLPHAQSKAPENVSLLSDKHAANQPFSPMSMSSIGSLPSPLFDKDICDAFPSVPTDTPMPNLYLPRSRGQGFTAAATAASADFDSALLSSAIHLAARNKASTPSDYTVPPTR